MKKKKKKSSTPKGPNKCESCGETADGYWFKPNTYSRRPIFFCDPCYEDAMRRDAWHVDILKPIDSNDRAVEINRLRYKGNKAN